MSRKVAVRLIAVLVQFTLICGQAAGDLPADFPTLTINQYGETAPGYVVGSVGSTNPEVGSYFMIMDNAGVPVLYSDTQSLGTLTCNGLFEYRTEIPGMRKKYTWFLKDRDFNEVDSFQMGNGYLADNHDFQLLPNGHALMICYDTQIVDMSQVVPGGHPAAQVTGAVIQELDVEKNVIFQWRSWDHIPIVDTYQNPRSARFGYIHVNSIEFDETDGNIILSCRETSEVIKISRATGEVMWRMGGKNNEFTFINEHPENAPRYFKLMHDVRRYGNGHLSMFDNGADAKDMTRPYSRAVEYDLDEQAKTATMVWEYRNDPDFLALNGGDCIRLPNGNTIVRWGGAAQAGEAPAMSEVNPSGELVYEIWPAQEGVTGGFNRIPWPLESVTEAVTRYEVSQLNEYVFDEGDAETGVTLKINALDGEGYNELSVQREPFAPLYPVFPGKAPQVLPVRVAVAGQDIQSIEADMSFDAESFGFADATGEFGYVDPYVLTVYHRPTVGAGVFAALATTYNPVKKELATTLEQFGEFILGFPDVAEIPNAPMLLEPADQGTVNQELPVGFAWTPRGFARYHHLQVSTDEEFTTLLVDEQWMTESRYTWDAADPGTTYHYRVKITNDGGDSEWSVGSFTTVPPMIEVRSPNGGENWPCGLDLFILWDDNIDEDVVIELYKGGEFVDTIRTNRSTGVYEWEVDLALEPGYDYSVKIKSADDEAVFDESDATFSIDVPQVSGLVRLDDGWMALEWTGSIADVFVDFTETMDPADWQTIGGPFSGGSVSVRPASWMSTGFFRLRTD